MPEQIRLYWGRRVKLRSDSPEVFQAICALLPEAPPQAGEADTTFTIRTDAPEPGLYQDTKRLWLGNDTPFLLELLEDHFQMDLACKAPDGVFVHAGVVALGGRCLLLPGQSYSGKSTLVRELVRLGGDYFSDEFAVIDASGWVHPYRRPLKLRGGPEGLPTRVPLTELPCPADVQRAAIGLVALTRYDPGGCWQPVSLSAGRGLLALLENTVSAQLSPERDLVFLTRAITRARFLESPRGEAADTAVALLRSLADDEG